MKAEANTLVFGALGGLSPVVVKLGSDLIAGSRSLPAVDYWAGVAIFAGLGAIVALVLAERDSGRLVANVKLAFTTGVTAPALIAAWIAGAEPPSQAIVDTGPGSSGVPGPSGPEGPLGPPGTNLQFDRGGKSDFWWALGGNRGADG